MTQLPQIPRRMVTTEMPQSRVSAADIAATYRSAADALAAGGQALADYEHATGLRTYTKLADEARTKLQELSTASNSDPAAFEKSWQTYSRDILRKTSGTAGNLIAQDLTTLGGNEKRRIIGENATRDISNSKKAIESEIGLLRDEAATWARVAGTASPDYQAARTKIGTLYDQLSGNAAFGVPKEQAATDLKRLDAQHMAEGIVGTIDRTFRDEGMAAAETEARRLLWDPQLDLSPEERRVYVARATEYLQTTDAQRKVALAGAREQATEIKSMLDADPRLVDDALVDNAIRNLASLGDVAGAMDLATKRSGVRFLAGSFAAAGDAGQVDLYKRMFSPDGQGTAGLVARSREAIARIESAGSGDYAAIGPATADGDRAYGRYQVMGANIGDWTEAALGKRMTPAEFLADEKAQDAVFDDRFGKLVAQYGNAVDAASVWFTGRPATTGAGTSDVLGTTGAEYVQKFAEAMGAEGLPYNPATDPATVKAMRTEITADFKTHWTTMQEGLAKNLPPSAADLALLADQMAIVDDPALKQEVAAHFQNHADGYLLRNLPPAQREAYLSAIQSDANGFDAGQMAAIKALEQASAAATQQLKDDPLGFAIGQQIADPPAVMDFANPASVTAGLGQRQQIADVVSQRFQTGPVSALRPAEADQVKAYWQGATAEQRVALLGTMAQTLKSDTLMATLATFAGKPDTQMFAVAGALAKVNQPAAAAIVRGEAALAQNPNFAFAVGGEQDKADRDAYFPASVLAPTMTAAWQSHMDAARAIYADASARAGDTSGKFNEDRWQSAIDQVTGGVVEFNGEKTVAPASGVDQARFDGAMAAIQPWALGGAVTPDGTPLTLDFVRREGHLKGYGDGRYLIELGGTGAYALAAPRDTGDITGPFVLDLRPWLDAPASDQRNLMGRLLDPSFLFRNPFNQTP